jgi:cytochrome c biogenesis factor
LLGIFLTRSGVLTSVHSFAVDLTRGFAMIVLVLLIGVFGCVELLFLLHNRFHCILIYERMCGLCNAEVKILLLLTVKNGKLLLSDLWMDQV